ncbi:hypothetical protein HZH68_007236 [Vespula germanica]|uniref:Uncharacterized protein n=1 Tax=Vespula germanica TaxID=30212 RepID=A0A834KCM2_VESGE|nr:hypothetical protein HZH68_007236 [Vespula germanica]
MDLNQTEHSRELLIRTDNSSSLDAGGLTSRRSIGRQAETETKTETEIEIETEAEASKLASKLASRQGTVWTLRV